jgi:F0F1-type ATP synthase membrane subunit b/b'
VERGKRQLDAERTRMVSDVEKAASSLVIRLTQAILQREFTTGDQDRLLKTLEQSISTPAHATK